MNSEINQEHLVKIIDTYIPPGLWGKGAVAAGGFALWAYTILNSPSVLSGESRTTEDFIKNLDDIKFTHQDFGDIDLWFYDWSEYHTDKDLGPLVNIPAGIEECDRDKYVATVTNSIKDITSLQSKVIRISKWANTVSLLIPQKKDSAISIIAEKLGLTSYNFSKEEKFQFLKEPINHVDDLFKRFDILNCCVAITEGNNFIFLPEALDAIRNKEIEISSDVPDRDFVTRIHSAERLFKYQNRYKWKLSDRACEFLFMLYIDLIDHPLTKEYFLNDKNLDEWKFANIQMLDSEIYIEIPDTPNNETIAYYIHKLIFKFRDFIKMENYKEEYNLFLLNCGITPIEKAIEEYYYEE